MASLKKLGSEISTIFVVLSLPVALVLSNYHADEESRTLIFKEEVPNKALHGHVIRTEQVLNDGGCRVQCYLEPDCVSINVGPLKDGSHQCDLNGVTDDEEFAVVLTNTTGFTYNGVENLCRHGPCTNNGTCQAGFTSQGFRCICPIGILGKKCERDFRVGCFKVANHLRELGDLTGEIKWNNTDEAVKKCAKLTKNEGFKLFALGKGGVCLSGQDMKDKYLDNGTANAQCHHGIGIEDSMFVYSLELFSLQPIGCHKDKQKDRALSHLYLNIRDGGGGIQWNKTRHHGLDLVVKECSEKAYEKGYEYFGVQHYGECYGNGTDYSKHGKLKMEECYVFDNRTGHGVGREHTNFVYRILNHHFLNI